jgi:hypothetical protein
LYQNFLEEREKTTETNGSSREQLIQEFVIYARARGSSRVLAHINTQQPVILDDIADYGVSIETLTTHPNTLALYTSTSINHRDLMDQTYTKIKQVLDGSEREWSDFAASCNIEYQERDRKIYVTDASANTTDVRDITALRLRWKGFLASKGLHDPQVDSVIPQQTHPQYLMMTTLREKVADSLDVRVRQDFLDHIGTIDAYGDTQTINDMMNQIREWIYAHPDQRDTVNGVVLRNGDIFRTYQQLGGTGSIQDAYTDRDPALKQLLDTNSSISSIISYPQSKEFLEQAVHHAEQSMSVADPRIGTLSTRWSMLDTDISTHPASVGYTHTLTRLTDERRDALQAKA